MIASIMQPYFFPYLGYFQLMAASDIFVLHDDVQYAKGGWVNRNRILLNGKPAWFTAPVTSGAHELPIASRDYAFTSSVNARLFRRIEGAYRQAPHYEATLRLLQGIMTFADSNIARFNANLLAVIADALGIAAKRIVSSTLAKDNQLQGQARVIDICKVIGARHYVNPIGGAELYDAVDFARAGIQLGFLKPGIEPYVQGPHPFVPSLSIIDVLMHNDIASVRAMLSRCRIVTPGDPAV